MLRWYWFRLRWLYKHRCWKDSRQKWKKMERDRVKHSTGGLK